MQLTAVYLERPTGYVAFVEELPGANAQGDTLDEVRENLREAVELVLEANRELAERATPASRLPASRSCSACREGPRPAASSAGMTIS